MNKWLLAASLGAGLSLCSLQSAHANILDGSVSVSKEKQLGQDAAADIEKNAPLVSGPVEQWVQRVGARLAKVSNPEFEYTFHVIDSPEINAFCLPGGHVFVYSGLRKVVHTDDELAGVLAHEITHAELHHYAKQSKKNGLRDTLLGIASIAVGLPGIAQAGLSVIDASLTARYSRDAEYQADHEGVLRMKRAGFDPNAMATVLERLADEDDATGMDRWLSDHPEGKKRVAAVQAEIAGLPNQPQVSQTTLSN